MGLGEVLFKLGTKPTPPRAQQSGQTQSVDRDFVTKYLKCLGLNPNELNKVMEVLKGRGVNEDTIKCIEGLVKSVSWDELFVKLNLEIALLESVARHELQQLMGHDGSASSGSLALSATYSSILSITIIRQLVGNENTRSIALATLSKVTYILFDVLMELAKRKAIPPNLEVEMWKVRETLVEIMEELFKGNRMIAMDGKSFDGNGERRR